MRARDLGLFVFFNSVLLVSFSEGKIGAQDAPKSQKTTFLPDVEATQKKVAVIKDGASDLKELFDKLKDLGDPATRKDNESDQQYIGRAERILKGRALYVHFAHQEMVRIMEARYGAEHVLEEYDRWVKSRLEALMLSTAKLSDEAARIEGIKKDFGFDAVVLAKLISEDPEYKKKRDAEVALIAVENEKKIPAPPEKVGFRTLITAISSDLGKDDNARLKKIADFQVRADKLKSLSRDEKIKKFYDFKKAFKDAQFESSYLSQAVIPENQKFAISLPKAHQNLLGELKSSLAANKALFEQLDDSAYQLSVMARYTRENLGLVSSIKDVTEATDALVKVNNSEKSIKVMLTNFLSLPGQLADDFVGKSLTGDVGSFVDGFKDPNQVNPDVK